jgi:hypothetical protein
MRFSCVSRLTLLREARRAPCRVARRVYALARSVLSVAALLISPAVTLATFGWTEWLALAALAISALSFALAFRADRRAGRAEERAERGDRRDEERFERERKEADAANRARLAIWPNGSSSGVDDRRFAYIIRNHGKVTAHEVHVWLYDENGQDVSIKPQAGFALAPDESADQYGVTAPLDVQPEDVRFGIRWFDGAGHHKALTHIRRRSEGRRCDVVGPAAEGLRHRRSAPSETTWASSEGAHVVSRITSRR